MPTTPIALFTYNRPIHTAAALESLSQCTRLDECHLHIYCDGPAKPEHSAAVKESRQVVRDWETRLGAEVIERDVNLGLASSIISGVTELCDRHGRVIVLEDDLVVNRSFVDFMIQALDRYENEPKVYQISGYMFPVEQPAATDAFFLPLTTTWGWATWSRAWRSFDPDPSGAREFLRLGDRRRFDLDGAYPYSNMLEDRLQGKNDSWGILFWWSVFKANGLALHPRESLVWNGGFDNTGTHCRDRSWSNQPTAEIVSGGDSARSFLLPEKVVADEDAFHRIKQFLRREQYPTSLTGRLWRRLERYVARPQNRPLM